MKQENALASCSFNMIVIDVVVDVSGTLKDEVAVETTRYLVFLEERCTATCDVHSVAEGRVYLVQKDMRMGVTVNFDTYLLVEPDQIVADFRSIPGPPDKESSLFIL